MGVVMAGREAVMCFRSTQISAFTLSVCLSMASRRRSETGNARFHVAIFISGPSWLNFVFVDGKRERSVLPFKLHQRSPGSKCDPSGRRPITTTISARNWIHCRRQQKTFVTGAHAVENEICCYSKQRKTILDFLKKEAHRSRLFVGSGALRGRTNIHVILTTCR